MHKNKKIDTSQLSASTFYDIGDLGRVREMRDYIDAPDFPCVGAKAALSQGAVTIRVYDDLAEPDMAPTLHFDLIEYIAQLDLEDPRIQSFMALFPNSDFVDEETFETALFDQLAELGAESERLNIDWHPDVSDDPENPHFSMSIGGHPFFVVGMHPKSSRPARQTPFPVLVFNSNLQFDKLKADGRYDQLKKVIRKREMALNGSINPMLDDFGRSSEARQYSGRKLDESWKCPMHIKKAANDDT